MIKLTIVLSPSDDSRQLVEINTTDLEAVLGAELSGMSRIDVTQTGERTWLVRLYKATCSESEF